MGKAPKKSAKVKYPDKVTVNLALRPKTINSPTRALPLFLVILLLIGVFAKFGVVDQISRQLAAERERDAAAERLRAAVAANEDYDSVLAEYSRYSLSSLSADELSEVDRLKVIELIDNEFLANANVRAVSINGNTMLVQLSGLTLQGASTLVDSLLGYPIVSNVSVATAGADSASSPAAPDDSSDVTVSMTITLVQSSEEAN